jgi:glycosyltransferase involved in cell wall biosynthesis
MKKKAAHFLLIPELIHSPPNCAIINAYIQNGYIVDVFTPGSTPEKTIYGDSIRVFRVEYSWIWILRNIIHTRWFSYALVSGTSEDPLGIVGLICTIYRTKGICLVDEIKSGSYRGDRSELWKKICIRAIRNSNFSIVNDNSRIGLLRQYAGLGEHKEILVYPGCFYQRPEISELKRVEYRKSWGFSNEDFIIGSSGGFNMTAGADWLLRYIKENDDVRSVIQPLGVTPLSMFLLRNLDYHKRIFIQNQRMDWNEAWESAQGLDIGICIYMNQAPQFQNMGISSNRLCMFLAMGVPVIASRQESFTFLETYECGLLVEDYNDFESAVGYIKKNWADMRDNCGKCFEEYIRPSQRYRTLARRIGELRPQE